MVGVLIASGLIIASRSVRVDKVRKIYMEVYLATKMWICIYVCMFIGMF